jgi:hypothetical protein
MRLENPLALFLTPAELRELTGYAIKARQIAQLRIMGMPYRVNGCGRPVVTVLAVEGRAETQKTAASWQPAVLQGGR